MLRQIKMSEAFQTIRHQCQCWIWAYQVFPSYARVLAKEGLADPAELHLIGSWQQVLDGLAAYAEAGVSDLRIEVSAHTEAAREATCMALAEYLSA